MGNTKWGGGGVPGTQGPVQGGRQGVDGAVGLRARYALTAQLCRCTAGSLWAEEGRPRPQTSRCLCPRVSWMLMFRSVGRFVQISRRACGQVGEDRALCRDPPLGRSSLGLRVTGGPGSCLSPLPPVVWKLPIWPPPQPSGHPPSTLAVYTSVVFGDPRALQTGFGQSRTALQGLDSHPQPNRDPGGHLERTLAPKLGRLNQDHRIATKLHWWSNI